MEKRKRSFTRKGQVPAPTIESCLDTPLINAGGGIILVKDANHRFVASNTVFSRFSGVDPHKLTTCSDSSKAPVVLPASFERMWFCRLAILFSP